MFLLNLFQVRFIATDGYTFETLGNATVHAFFLLFLHLCSRQREILFRLYVLNNYMYK